MKSVCEFSEAFEFDMWASRIVFSHFKWYCFTTFFKPKFHLKRREIYAKKIFIITEHEILISFQKYFLERWSYITFIISALFAIKHNSRVISMYKVRF